MGRRKGGSKFGVDSVRFSLGAVFIFPIASSVFRAELVLECIEVGIVLSDPDRVCFRFTSAGLSPGLRMYVANTRDIEGLRGSSSWCVYVRSNSSISKLALGLLLFLLEPDIVEQQWKLN